MNTQETQWNLLSWRLPQDEEFPVMLGRWDCDVWMDYACFSCSQLALFSNSTHWRSIKADPPPKVRTQWELDEEAFEEWFVTVEAGNHTRGAWHAALAHERAEVKRGAP